jgi:hypothetical protein
VLSFLLCNIMRLSVSMECRGLDNSTRFLVCELGCTYVWSFLLGHRMRLSDPIRGTGLDVSSRFSNFEFGCT